VPDLRAAMAKHIEQEPLSFEWTAAVALRVINLGWFRVGDARYAKTFRTFGITTLRKGHVRVRGSRIAFRYRNGDGFANLTGQRLNDYIREHMGDDFTAKDFRTWGGTLLAAIELAERDEVETETERKRTVAAVMRTVGERLGNTPAVARASYVSPAVVEQYLDGRTIDDFRPRHLRVVGARDMGLDLEEHALLSLLRSWRIRRAREAA
jgi:DNA topoisomerase I